MLRSPPVQNARPAPASTTTVTPSSSRTRRNAASSSAAIVRSIALYLSGRFRVMVATRPSTW